MAGTLTLPGIGPVKKPQVLLGAAAVIGIVGIAYMRHRNAAAAGSSTAAADTTGSGYAYDTGLTGAAGGYSTPTYSQYGYDQYGNPLPSPAAVSTVTTQPGGVYNNNNDWLTAAETALEPTGVSTATSGGAIAKVLGGNTVTTVQKDLFLRAVGILGPPPQGYPTPIKVSDPTAVPNPPAPKTTKPGRAGGLHAVNVTTSSIRLDWNPVKGVQGYHMHLDGHEVTSSVYSVFTFSGLKPGHSYSLGVVPFNSAGNGPQSTIHVSTHKK